MANKKLRKDISDLIYVGLDTKNVSVTRDKKNKIIFINDHHICNFNYMLKWVGNEFVVHPMHSTGVWLDPIMTIRSVEDADLFINAYTALQSLTIHSQEVTAFVPIYQPCD